MNMTIRGLQHWIAWGLITIKQLEGTVEPAENLLNDWTDDHPPLEGFSTSVWKSQPSNPAKVLIDGKFEQHNFASSPPFLYPDPSGFLLDHSHQGQHLRDTLNPIENMVDSISENEKRKSFASYSKNYQDSNPAGDIHVYPGVLSMGDSLLGSTNSFLGIHQGADYYLHGNLEPIANWVGGNGMNHQATSFSPASSYRQDYDMENPILLSQLEQGRLPYDLIFRQLESSDGSRARHHEDRSPVVRTQHNTPPLSQSPQEPDSSLGIYQHFEPYLRPGSATQQEDASTQNYQEIEPGNYASYNHRNGCSANSLQAKLKNQQRLASSSHSQEMDLSGIKFRSHPEHLPADWKAWQKKQTNLVNLKAISNSAIPANSQQHIEIFPNQFLTHPGLDSNCSPGKNPILFPEPICDIFNPGDSRKRYFYQGSLSARDLKKQKSIGFSFEDDCKLPFKEKEPTKLEQGAKNLEYKDDRMEKRRFQPDARNVISTVKQVQYDIHHQEFDSSNLLRFNMNALNYFKLNSYVITELYNSRRLESLIKCIKSFENQEIYIKNVYQFDLLVNSCKKNHRWSGKEKGILKSKKGFGYNLRRYNLKESIRILFSHRNLWLKYWERKYQSNKHEKLELQDKYLNTIRNIVQITNIKKSEEHFLKLCMIFLFYVDMLNTILATDDEFVAMDKNISGLYLNRKSENNVAQKSTSSIIEKALFFFEDVSIKDALKRKDKLEMISNLRLEQSGKNSQLESMKYPSKIVQLPEFNCVLWSYLEKWISEFPGQLKDKNPKLYQRIKDFKSLKKIMNSIFDFSIHYLNRLLQLQELEENKIFNTY